jgi:coenzyme F420-reducing hydrogenase delta subunit
MNATFKAKIAIFYCINSFTESAAVEKSIQADVTLDHVKLACSSMVKDVYLLRAFEAGADAVVVLVCPEGHCRYVEGNLRAKKRVAWVQALLDEIGLDGRRLALYNIDPQNPETVAGIIDNTAVTLADIGPSPAK